MHRLRLEAVTGLDYLALQQDFGAKKILADNLCTLLSDLDAPHGDRHAWTATIMLAGALTHQNCNSR